MNGGDACPLCKKSKLSTLWKSSSFELRFCHECALTWAHGAGEPVIPTYSRDYYERNYDPQNSSNISFFRNQIQSIAPSISGRRVLDVGFGTGIFLEEAYKQGWEVAGIESSEEAFHYAQARMGDHSRLVYGDLLHADFRSGEFDLVCFWDVLAHVPDPRAYLLRACELLDKNGILVIKTPARSAAFFKVLRYIPSWIRESLIHWPWQQYFFSPESLRYVLGSKGLGKLEVRFFKDLPGRRLPLIECAKHPKGAFLGGAHWVYARLFGTGSMIITAKRDVR